MAHEDCLQGKLGQPGTAFQMDQGGVQAAVVDREYMQANTKAKSAHTIALENKWTWLEHVEIQNMKSIMQTMAEVVHAMQSMMVSNASAGLAAPGSFVGERPKKQSHRVSLTE